MSEKVKNTETQKEPVKGKSVVKKIINIVINIMIVLVLITSVLIAILALTSKNNDGISTVFGHTIQPIQSDSMKGESPDGYPGGNFETGDLMIAKPTGYDEKATYELGDIITFRTADTDGNIMLIVHRIVKVVKDDNGNLRYQTQGDNHETSPAPDQMEEVNYLFAADIGSVYYSSDYQGKIFKGWGKVLDFLQSQQGFFFAVLLPMIIFFMYELIRVVMNAMNYKKAKADEDKDEAVKAAVAAALASQNEDNASDTDAADEAASDAESAEAVTEEAGSDEKAEDKPAEESVKMTAEQLEQFKQFQEFQKMQKAQQEQENTQKEQETTEE